MTRAKILSEINQLKMFAELIINKATMLEQGLSFVVTDKPARKGKAFPDSEKAKILLKAERRRTRK
ncbi:MAG: hypothetical protein H7Z76_13465 [Methylotenera sp.]|nr:hypothetical protein [Flavobacterium sp.]